MGVWVSRAVCTRRNPGTLHARTRMHALQPPLQKSVMEVADLAGAGKKRFRIMESVNKVRE